MTEYDTILLSKMKPGVWHTISDMSKLGGRCRRRTFSAARSMHTQGLIEQRPSPDDYYRTEYRSPDD